MAQGDKENTALYVLLGCAGLLVVALCAATGLGVWIVTEQAAAVPPVAYPTPPPGSPPGRLPTMPSPPGPKPPAPTPRVPLGPALPPPPSFAPPMLVRATVEAVDGASPVALGDACEFTVERHADSSQPVGYWCRTQIVCGGRLLYGGATAGYFPCTLTDASPATGAPRSVVGRDDTTTSGDTDASMTLDTTSGTLTIADDAAGSYGAYSLRARITEVR